MLRAPELTALSHAKVDPRLEPLMAGYVRGTLGAAEVLHDALLERSLEPLPLEEDPTARLERTLALLAPAAQTRIGCASVRRVLGHFTREGPTHPAPERALAALEAGDARQLESCRKGVFDAWLQYTKSGRSAAATRVVWSVWMLLRDQPVIALRSARAIDPDAELEAQIDLVARTLGG